MNVFQLVPIVQVESLIKKKAEEAYINPELADQEKQKGNESFKKGDWAQTVKFYSEAIRRNPKEINQSSLLINYEY